MSVVVILAAYVIAKLDDKLVKERAQHKMVVRELADENYEQSKKIRKAELEMMKAEHSREALQLDYDRLLADYHLLERGMKGDGKSPLPTSPSRGGGQR